MKEKKYFFVFLVTSLVLASIGVKTHAADSFINSIEKQELIQAGKHAYNLRCSGCHGLDGSGSGPGAKMLTTKPRDFTKGIFKFKSTPIGSTPTNDDLMHTLNRGIPGSSMPSFILVSDAEKLALIEYIKTFAPDAWNKNVQEQVVPKLPQPKNVFTDKAEFLKYAARGRAWFQELGCVACHGRSGEGNGSSAATLQDSWGNSISPANLQKPIIKRGDTIDDVAYSIMMGVDGTPMPAHIEALNSLEEKFPEIKQKGYIWDLAAYVFYLRGVGAGLYDKELTPIPETGIPPEEIKEQIGKYLE